MVIATHSSELMNEVDFSHIIYIQRGINTSKYIATQNRELLEEVRQQIGSSFNLVASQFEDVERLIFSENIIDYEILKQIAARIGLNVRTHNIPIFGLNKWHDCIQYKKAHKIFFGKESHFSLLLDRDFYPKEYLDLIDRELLSNGIRTVFTPGNEIENIFLDQEFLLSVLPTAVHNELLAYLNIIYSELHEPTLIKYVESQKKYSSKDRGKEFFTLYEELKPSFNSRWNDVSKRHQLPDGKQVLIKIRQFAKEKANMNLSTSFLVQKLVDAKNSDTLELIFKIYEIRTPSNKVITIG